MLKPALIIALFASVFILLTCKLTHQYTGLSYANFVRADNAQLSTPNPTPTPTVPQIIETEFAKEGQAVIKEAKTIAKCESSFNKDAVNTKSSATGAFQILPSTWNRFCVDLSNPKDAAQNIQCAHRLYSYDVRENNDGWSQWDCTTSGVAKSTIISRLADK